MNAFYKALAVMGKDLLVLSKDRAYVLSMFLIPLVIAFMNGAMFGGGGQVNLPVILVNQDEGVYGKAVGAVLEAIPELNLTGLDSPAEAENGVVGGEYLAAVIIPASLTQNLNAYQPSQITVMIDPAQAQYGQMITAILEEVSEVLTMQSEIRYGIQSVLAEMGLTEAADPDLARAAQAQVEGVLFTQMQRVETEAPLRLQTDTLQGKQVFSWSKVADVMLPSLTVMFAFFIIPALATELLKEKEAGSLRRLVAAPLPRASLIGGKVMAYTLLVILQVGILFGIGAVIMDIPLGKSPLGLILITIALGLSATTLGMLVAAFSRTIEQAGSIGLLLIFLLGFLSGSFGPQMAPYRGEGFVATLSRFTPQAQAQLAYFNLMLQEGTLVDVLPYIGYLLGLSLVFFLVAIWRFKFD
jgi:ABC-2 type transport system permease protein